MTVCLPAIAEGGHRDPSSSLCCSCVRHVDSKVVHPVARSMGRKERHGCLCLIAVVDWHHLLGEMGRSLEVIRKHRRLETRMSVRRVPLLHVCMVGWKALLAKGIRCCSCCCGESRTGLAASAGVIRRHLHPTIASSLAKVLRLVTRLAPLLDMCLRHDV